MVSQVAECKMQEWLLASICQLGASPCTPLMATAFIMLVHQMRYAHALMLVSMLGSCASLA